MTCYCGAPIDGPGVAHPSGSPVYCSTECRGDAILWTIQDHLDTFARAANDLSFIYADRP